MAVFKRITSDELFQMSENVYAAMRGLDADNPDDRALKNALYAAHEALHRRGRSREQETAQ
mgnify:CR=1 FL=1